MNAIDHRAIIDGRRRGPMAAAARAVLRCATAPYGWAVAIRNARYDRGSLPTYDAGVPVVSVGNLTAGGTGKTPMVAAIAKHLRQGGVRVGIVSRGYRSDATGSNDEARELFDLLPDVPHVQNPDRVEASRVAVEELEMEAIVLDDGFQHRRLRRDLDIVLIDATCPFGYDALLPRGLLREPLASLCRADVVVITRAGRVSADSLDSIRQRIGDVAPSLPVVVSDHQPLRLIGHDQRVEPLEGLRNRPVIALAGIGNPAPFFATLEQLGASLVGTRAMRDHCGYDRGEVEELIRWIQELGRSEPDAMVVCTHKDLVKLRTARLGGMPLWALQIALRMIAGESALWQAVDRVVKERRPPR